MKDSLNPLAGFPQPVGADAPDGFVGDAGGALGPTFQGVAHPGPLDAAMVEPQFFPSGFVSHDGIVYDGHPGGRQAARGPNLVAPGSELAYSDLQPQTGYDPGWVQYFGQRHIIPRPKPRDVHMYGPGRASANRMDGYPDTSPPTPRIGLWDRVTSWPKAIMTFLNFGGSET